MIENHTLKNFIINLHIKKASTPLFLGDNFFLISNKPYRSSELNKIVSDNVKNLISNLRILA